MLFSAIAWAIVAIMYVIIAIVVTLVFIIAAIVETFLWVILGTILFVVVLIGCMIFDFFNWIVNSIRKVIWK